MHICNMSLQSYTGELELLDIFHLSLSVCNLPPLHIWTSQTPINLPEGGPNTV